eukprot:403339637
MEALIDDQQRSRINEILKFWYGEGNDRNMQMDPGSMRKWFGSSAEMDQLITENYKEDILKFERGEYNSWITDRDGKVAAIILLDQFTRNCFRKNKQAFSYDHIALSIAKSISDEEFLSYGIQDQMFIILPYEHDETLESQKKALHLCDLTIDKVNQIPDVPDQIKNLAKAVKDYAVKHSSVIEKYGRYPHRNEVLERESTEEEVEYLKTAERFGQ